MVSVTFIMRILSFISQVAYQIIDAETLMVAFSVFSAKFQFLINLQDAKVIVDSTSEYGDVEPKPSCSTIAKVFIHSS